MSSAAPRTAVYARYSTDLQRDASIEDQVRSCRQLLAREGVTEFETFADRAISGASMMRPGLQALLEAVRDGRIDIIAAEGIDRISRDQADIADIARTLRHAGVRLLTVQEGEVNELHVGLKGTMNALFLKDLAAKVRRGLEGRVRAGRSGGSLGYGYRVVQGAERGGRAIDPAEALVVERIFRDYAAGVSPRAIAHALNREGAPAPSGGSWNQSSINGNRRRGTGILNNELYAGRLVWNRQSFVKDPATGRRVGRENPPEKWVIERVPDLRIVAQDAWDAVKARQDAASTTWADEARHANTGHRLVRARRPKTLLSGLVRCGCCGGPMVHVHSGRMACNRARETKSCDNRLRIDGAQLERTVLAGVRANLLAADTFEAFARAYLDEANRIAMEENVARGSASTELATVVRQLNQLVDQILAGTPGRILAERLEQLEAKRTDLEALIARTPESLPYAHPNLPARWRAKVEALNGGLAAGDMGATEILRSLIDRVDLVPDGGKLRIDLHGEVAGMLAFCGEDRPPRPTRTGRLMAGSISLVAEERCQRYGRFESLVFRDLPLVA